jgi:hypothetical protein
MKETTFLKMVESSGVPEIVWGPSISGNYASSADAMTTLVKYVNDKRNQKNEPYTELWGATIRLYAQANMMNIDSSEITIEWNDMDSVSEATKAEIFAKFATGVSALITNAGATLKQIHYLWKSQFPKATDQDFEEFKKGLAETASHAQFAKASYADALGMQGKETQEEIDKMMNE